MRVIIGSSVQIACYGKDSADVRHFVMEHQKKVFSLEESLGELNVAVDATFGDAAWSYLERSRPEMIMFDGLETIDVDNEYKVQDLPHNQWYRADERSDSWQMPPWVDGAEEGLYSSFEILICVFGDDFLRGQSLWINRASWPFACGSFKDVTSWVNLGTITCGPTGMPRSRWVMCVLCATRKGYPYLGYLELGHSPSMDNML